MNKIIIILLTVICVAPFLYADEDAGPTGTFMRDGIGARPLGMGGAYTAISEGPEATYYNPAGLAFSKNVILSMSYKAMSLDRHLSQVAVLFPIRNEVTMAASWINAGASDVPGMGESRQILPDIKNNMNSFGLSFAKAVNKSLALGGNLKYLQEKYDNAESFTIGVDIGILARIKKLATVGGTVQNLGSVYRWNGAKEWTDGKSYDDKFPFLIKVGAAGNLLNQKFIPAIDIEKADKMGIRFRAGAEYWFTKTIKKQVPDEYEEGKMNTVQENVRWAGLRIGLDRGNPTFGASYAFYIKKISAGLEYAYLVGAAGTSGSHLMTLKMGF